MNIPKKKNEESLAMWRERLAQEFNLSPKVQAILDTVSIVSYNKGIDDIIEILKKENIL